jgi:peroxiredoxin/predicted 2-oxoglutarate/Fe(II)-dependent dioxygenase YbiX
MNDKTYRSLLPGDLAPPITQQTAIGQAMVFDFLAGKYTLLCFFGTAGDDRGKRMLSIIERGKDVFDGDNRAFMGVSVDKGDKAHSRVKQDHTRVTFIYDFDYSLSKAYGAMPENQSGAQISLRRHWVVLDPTLRIRAVFEAEPLGAEVDKVLDYMRALPATDSNPGFRVQAPILVLPNVFEPEFCRHLVELHRTDGGRETGFMRDVDGKTVEILDPRHKRRTDYYIEDQKLQALIQQKLVRRVVPEIKKVHQFDVTRMERFLIGCYDSETGGHFGQHRDNTTLGTAHRRFAVSVNLNSGFEGGEVGFPEYGPQTFKMAAGGAVVFSCSLLHKVTPVKTGRRYAFLPFLYDEAAAEVRQANRKFIGKKPEPADAAPAAG